MGDSMPYRLRHNHLQEDMSTDILEGHHIHPLHPHHHIHPNNIYLRLVQTQHNFTHTHTCTLTHCTQTDRDTQTHTHTHTHTHTQTNTHTLTKYCCSNADCCGALSPCIVHTHITASSHNKVLDSHPQTKSMKLGLQFSNGILPLHTAHQPFIKAIQNSRFSHHAEVVHLLEYGSYDKENCIISHTSCVINESIL